MANQKICFVSVDVEDDQNHPLKPLSQRTWRGVENLKKILNVFEEQDIPATLFITGQTLEKFPELAQEWSKKYEIACHSFTHNFLNTMSLTEREQDLEDYIKLYKNIFKKKPLGFRAPSHIIDEKQIELLQDKGFLYDSSVVPRFPFFMRYRGFKKKAPIIPYHPLNKDCRKKGSMKILEIPVSGLLLGIPLNSESLKYIPYSTYRDIFRVSSPKFLTFFMHSWDAVSIKSRISKNSGDRFIQILQKMIYLLKIKNYEFINGEHIARTFKTN